MKLPPVFALPPGSDWLPGSCEAFLDPRPEILPAPENAAARAAAPRCSKRAFSPHGGLCRDCAAGREPRYPLRHNEMQAVRRLGGSVARYRDARDRAAYLDRRAAEQAGETPLPKPRVYPYGPPFAETRGENERRLTGLREALAELAEMHGVDDVLREATSLAEAVDRVRHDMKRKEP